MTTAGRPDLTAVEAIESMRMAMFGKAATESHDRAIAWSTYAAAIARAEKSGDDALVAKLKDEAGNGFQDFDRQVVTAANALLSAASDGRISGCIRGENG